MKGRSTLIGETRGMGDLRGMSRDILSDVAIQRVLVCCNLCRRYWGIPEVDESDDDGEDDNDN